MLEVRHEGLTAPGIVVDTVGKALPIFHSDRTNKWLLNTSIHIVSGSHECYGDKAKRERMGSFIKCYFIKWPEKVSLSKDQMEVRAGICCYLGKSLEAGKQPKQVP